MYSASLHASHIWSSTIPCLTSPHPTGLNLRKGIFSTHHLTIPIPISQDVPNTKNASASTTHNDNNVHVLLCSPSGVYPATSLSATLERIERLVNHTGGSNIALIFLLQAVTPVIIRSTAGRKQSQSDLDPMARDIDNSPLHAYLTLQSSLLTHTTLSHSTIPILPITDTTSLIPVLRNHLIALSHRSHPTIPQQHETPTQQAFNLLRHCTSSAPRKRLSEHTCYVITDIAGSLRDVARNVEGVVQGLKGVVEEEERVAFEDFWKEEWVVE